MLLQSGETKGNDELRSLSSQHKRCGIDTGKCWNAHRSKSIEFHLINSRLIFVLQISQVCITQVKLSISPATIELLSRCHATMVGYSATEETGDVIVDLSTIWEPKSFVENDYWFLKPGKSHTLYIS